MRRTDPDERNAELREKTRPNKNETSCESIDRRTPLPDAHVPVARDVYSVPPGWRPKVD